MFALMLRTAGTVRVWLFLVVLYGFSANALSAAHAPRCQGRRHARSRVETQASPRETLDAITTNDQLPASNLSVAAGACIEWRWLKAFVCIGDGGSWRFIHAMMMASPCLPRRQQIHMQSCVVSTPPIGLIWKWYHPHTLSTATNKQTAPTDGDARHNVC